MDIDDENVKIKLFLSKKEGNLLASATISLNTVEFGFVTIKGFQIWKSKFLNSRLQQEVNISPPSTRRYGKYSYLVFFKEEKQWFSLETRIYDAYNKALFRHNKKGKEDIDPDEIPL